jgi:hypothetical protein
MQLRLIMPVIEIKSIQPDLVEAQASLVVFSVQWRVYKKPFNKQM